MKTAINYNPGAGWDRWLAAWLLMLLTALGGVRCISADGVAPMPEPQVKALCLANFAKYVDWPAEGFAKPDSPIVIGVVGSEKIAGNLKQAVAGKSIAGRAVEVRQLSADDDPAGCQMLFIGASEKKRVAEILERTKDKPVLTVGETDQFTQQGGAIGLVKKEGKIRFEIDLNAARRAHLQISSKLLSLADTVTGK